jgi:hypothetical protein
MDLPRACPFLSAVSLPMAPYSGYRCFPYVLTFPCGWTRLVAVPVDSYNCVKSDVLRADLHLQCRGAVVYNVNLDFEPNLFLLQGWMTW